MSLAAVFDKEGNANVVEVPRREPGEGQLEVKIHSGALNPIDWKHFAFQWGQEGDVIGSDSSGVVTKVGAGVTGFEIGDNVSSFSHGGYANDKFAGSFQQYAIYDAVTTLKYGELKKYDGKDTIDSFENASTVTLGLSTVGMSLSAQFGLDPTKKYPNDWIFILAGTSATGILAIQVAKKMFGLKVVTTANPKYNDYLTSLGADVVVNSRSDDVIGEIKKATNDDVKYALDTVSTKPTFNLANEALRTNGDAFLDNLMVLQPDQLDSIKPNVKISGTLVYLVVGREQNLNGMVIPANEGLVNVHKNFFKEVNKLLLDGTIKSAPVTLLPNGLNSVTDGFNKLKEGVHCTKLVFNMEDTK